MAENENKKSGAKQAADAAKTAVNVAKGAGRMAAGVTKAFKIFIGAKYYESFSPNSRN